MTALLQYISERTFLSQALRKSLEQNFERILVKKGEIILREDTRANYLYFIQKGLLSNYYFLADGKKVNSWFYNEHQFITAWSSFYQQKPSFEVIEAMEDCELYRLSYTNFQKLIADFPAFNNFARLLAEEMLTFIDEFSRGWAFLSAKEKYQRVRTYFPDIELRIKLGLLSSFLGISQETLSRIRAVRNTT